MTVKHLYPDVEPSLNLDFANTKRLDPRITFSRSSTATYVGSDGLIKTAPINGARFDHDPETGDSLGLLIEEARTNLVTYSEDLTDASWLKGSSTVTGNAIAAPDGTLTADKLVENTATTSHVVSKAATTTAAAHTFSVYLKKAERSFAMLYDLTNGLGAYFDLNTGAISTGGSGVPAAPAYSSQNVGNGWWRCSITTTATAASNTYRVYLASSSTVYSYTGDGASGVYIWGAQLEQSSFPTSYIPTAGATVTRAADVAQITGTNFSSWYNTSESTWYAEGDQVFINSNGNQDGVNSLFVDRYANISTQRWREGSWRGTQGSTGLIPPFATSTTPKGSKAKTAYAIDGTNARMCVGGVLSNSASLGAYPSVTELRIGESARLLATDKWKGHISRLTYYPVRLPDATLQALTL